MAVDAEKLVLEFCDAVGKHDAEALRPYLSDDVVYHNIPMDRVVGADNAVAFIAGFFAMCDSLTIETLHSAAKGTTVLTERIDTFRVGDRAEPLPVMGTFEVQDGKIAAWRDYFDLAQIMKFFSGAE
ncbi:MAG: limonene-1,2-epoxide hydrolase family protein [Acidimicrobiales bacterium]